MKTVAALRPQSLVVHGACITSTEGHLVRRPDRLCFLYEERCETTEDDGFRPYVRNPTNEDDCIPDFPARLNGVRSDWSVRRIPPLARTSTPLPRGYTIGSNDEATFPVAELSFRTTGLTDRVARGIGTIGELTVCVLHVEWRRRGDDWTNRGARRTQRVNEWSRRDPEAVSAHEPTAPTVE